VSITAEIVIALVAGIIIGAAFSYVLQRSRSIRLKDRFGPEYSRTVAETGDRWKAESELQRRAKRVERLRIRGLEPNERRRFVDAWKDVQARFIDDPDGTLVEADRLVGSVMSAEGYPVGDFEQRAADISVDHPRVVDNYRAAHQVALRHGESKVATEDLRRAMIHYRTLFEELVGEPELSRTGGMV